MQVHVTSARCTAVDVSRVIDEIRALPALVTQITHNDLRAVNQADVVVVLMFEATDRDDAEIGATLERAQQNHDPTVVFGPWLSRHTKRRKHQVARVLARCKIATTLPQVFHWLQQRLPRHVGICNGAAARGDLVGLQWLWDHRWPWDRSVNHNAARNGHLHVLQWAHRCSSQWPPFDQQTDVYAARGGHLHVLEWLNSISQVDPEQVCLAAIPSGHLHVLQWVDANGLWPASLNDTLYWDETICATAAEGGHGHVLQWLLRHNVHWNKTWTLGAAEGGHLNLLQTLRAPDPPCPWDTVAICAAAAGAGRLELLQWVHAQDPHWNWGEVHICTIRGGHMAVLQWLWTLPHEDNDPDGEPWDHQFCSWAAHHGELAILQWLRTQGCRWDAMDIEEIFEQQDFWPQFYQACQWLTIQVPRFGYDQPTLRRWQKAIKVVTKHLWPYVLCGDVAHLIQGYI